jgi:septin family protein
MKDSRLHLCIFFLSGPWISDSDWQIMKKLKNEIMIIPVIAKGDCYTISERRLIKEAFVKRN